MLGTFKNIKSYNLVKAILGDRSYYHVTHEEIESQRCNLFILRELNGRTEI
jgi:hypothetical protein